MRSHKAKMGQNTTKICYQFVLVFFFAMDPFRITTEMEPVGFRPQRGTRSQCPTARHGILHTVIDIPRNVNGTNAERPCVAGQKTATLNQGVPNFNLCRIFRVWACIRIFAV